MCYNCTYKKIVKISKHNKVQIVINVNESDSISESKEIVNRML